MNMYVITIEIVLIFLLLLIVTIILRDQKPTFQFYPAFHQATKNQMVKVNLIIENVKLLGTFQFNILFDSGILQAKSAIINTLAGNTDLKLVSVNTNINNSTNPGIINFKGTQSELKGNAIDNSVQVSIKFMTQCSGSSILELQNIKVCDIDGDELAIKTINSGEVIVIPKENG